MAEYHFPVPGSEKEGEIEIFVRRHWASFLGQFFLSFVLLLIPIVIIVLVFVLDADRIIFQGVITNFAVLILSAYYLVAITFAFVAWMSFYYNCYIVTKSEIIEITQVGFFGRKISQLSLLRVQDVTSNIQGFLPTFFAYGNVLVETASEQKESFFLQCVPNPQEISSKIMELHDQVIEQEGRHREILEGEGTLVPGSHLPSPEIKEETEGTPYKKLLEKDAQEKSEDKEKSEGEISKNDLEKGGEIDIK